MSLDRRKHQRRVMMAVGLGILVGCLAGVTIGALRWSANIPRSTGGVISPKSDARESGSEASTPSPAVSSPDDEIAKKVLAVCQQAMPAVGCGCFWSGTREVFTDGTVEPLLAVLAERDKWGPIITRARLREIVGEEGERKISSALFTCYRR